jgi:DNA-directed RNA polymerase specialized sigma24 family protein
VQAQALTMRILFDLSIQQMTTTSAVSVNPVKTRLRLAEAALRRRIVEDSGLAIAPRGQR